MTSLISCGCILVLQDEFEVRVSVDQIQRGRSGQYNISNSLCSLLIYGDTVWTHQHTNGIFGFDESGMHVNAWSFGYCFYRWHHGLFEDNEQHEEHLWELLGVWRRERLYAKFLKCDFWLREVQFLGDHVNKNGFWSTQPRLRQLCSGRSWSPLRRSWVLWDW